MTPLDQLRQVLAAVPRETLVPAGWVIDQLGDTTSSPADAGPELLTVSSLAALLHRAPSTVRGWLQRGDFESAAVRVHGRSWLVPREAVTGFLERQRGRRGPERSVAGGPQPVGDLGAWRKVRPKGGTA